MVFLKYLNRPYDVAFIDFEHISNFRLPDSHFLTFGRALSIDICLASRQSHVPNIQFSLSARSVIQIHNSTFIISSI